MTFCFLIKYQIWGLKTLSNVPWLALLSGKSVSLPTRGLQVPFSLKSMYLGCRSDPHPQSGCVQEATNQCVSYHTLSTSLFPSLLVQWGFKKSFFLIKIKQQAYQQHWCFLYWGLKRRETDKQTGNEYRVVDLLTFFRGSKSMLIINISSILSSWDLERKY